MRPDAWTGAHRHGSAFWLGERLTDHYVLPSCSFGPQWGKSHGKRLANGVMTGVTPVELLLNDLTAPLQAGRTLPLTVHNVLTMPVQGTVTAKTSDGLVLAQASYPLSLKPGECVTVPAVLGACTPNEGNGYRVTVTFESPLGKAAVSEVVRVACARHGTPTIDGNLDDWKDCLPITVPGSAQKLDTTFAAWYIHKLDDFKAIDPQGAAAEVRTMWDEKNFYVAARVRTQKFEPLPRQATRKDDDFFGTGALSYTWIKFPWDGKYMPALGDSLQLGFGFGIGDPVRRLANSPTRRLSSIQDPTQARAHHIQAKRLDQIFTAKINRLQSCFHS